MESTVRLRDFDETRDFRILSSPFEFSIKLGTHESCNHSNIQWQFSSMLKKMSSFAYNYFASCISTYRERPETNEAKIKLEERLFNLVFPFHGGIPQSALNLVQRNERNERCELNDIRTFEFEVEQELVKCGKTVFGDEHSKVLLEHEYLKAQYPNKKFVLSDQIWPQWRAWAFSSSRRRPRLFDGVKQLIEGGTYFQTWKYFQSFKYFERSKVSRERRVIDYATRELVVLTLKGKFQFLFYLFSGWFLLCILFLFVEKTCNVLRKNLKYYISCLLGKLFQVLMSTIRFVIQKYAGRRLKPHATTKQKNKVIRFLTRR